jgi:hypothetical protein
MDLHGWDEGDPELFKRGVFSFAVSSLSLKIPVIFLAVLAPQALLATLTLELMLAHPIS